MQESRFHTKYRPSNLDSLIGNEAVVTRLRGMIAKKKFPSAILFTGPPGCGKTTIARAFAMSVNGNVSPENFSEMNMGESRSIEDVRGMIAIAKLRPMGAVRRFILCDEVHQLLANAPAANAFLKPLEEPVASTTYLLASMEPDKFRATTTGRAVASRCVNIQLSEPTPEDLKAQMRVIMVGEEMTYLSKATRAGVLQNSRSMRDVANQLESLASYWDGLPDKDKPEALPDDVVADVLGTGSNNSSVVAARFLLALYAKKSVAAFSQVIEIKDGFQFIQELLWMHWYVMTMVFRKGERHPAVWGSPAALELHRNTLALFNDEKSPVDRATQIERLSIVQHRLAKLKSESANFSVDEKQALAAASWEMIQSMP